MTASLTRLVFPTDMVMNMGESRASTRKALDHRTSRQNHGKCSRQSRSKGPGKYTRRRKKRHQPPSERHHQLRWERGVLLLKKPRARRKPRRKWHHKCHAAYYLDQRGSIVNILLTYMERPCDGGTTGKSTRSSIEPRRAGSHG